MSRSGWMAVSMTLGLALAGPAESASRIYKCKNAVGEIYYSHAYDAKRCAGGGAYLNSKGVPIKRIARQKTPEELAADKVAAEIAAQKAADKAAADLADRALTSTFATEQELHSYYVEQLTGIDSEIKAAGTALQSQYKSLGELLSAAADAERANKPVPPRVASNIALVRTQMEQQRDHLKNRRARRGELEVERDQRVKRFRELTDALAARRAERTE